MSFTKTERYLVPSRFGFAARSGRIANGMDADLVVLSADPAQDVSAFSKVRYTIRAGKVLYLENKSRPFIVLPEANFKTFFLQ